MSAPLRMVALRWAVVDLPTEATPHARLRWRTHGTDCGSLQLFSTRREARAVVADHNRNRAWGWLQRVAQVRVVIEEVT